MLQKSELQLGLIVERQVSTDTPYQVPIRSHGAPRPVNTPEASIRLARRFRRATFLCHCLPWCVPGPRINPWCADYFLGDIQVVSGYNIEWGTSSSQPLFNHHSSQPHVYFIYFF